MNRNLKALAVVCVGPLVLLMGTVRMAAGEEVGGVTAIDILLEPDATMVEHAEGANERLRKEFAEGFALDATHRPHISCLQRYVKTEDLDKVTRPWAKFSAASGRRVGS